MATDMNQQLGLFERRIVTINAHGLTLEQQFAEFHQANPHVYSALRHLALDAARHGRRLGIGMLFEVLRWQYAMTTTDEASEFKLNNNYRAFYARLLMEREPDLDGYFETRTQTWQTVKQ
jgi:hypothetical protein